MTDFTQLSADSVPEYLLSRRELGSIVHATDLESVVEVGDGNLNLVFIVRDRAGRGVVLKQSLPHVRTDPSWAMTQQRSGREATVLAEHRLIDPEHVPALYGFDPEHHVLAIEDLSDHRVWRTELNEGRVHAGAAAELGRYIARTGFATSVFGMPGPRKRALAATTVNVELAEITEDLVFSEPLTDHPHNVVLPENEDDLAQLASDAAVRDALGRAKLRFQDVGQSLLHGDLHTGSVFVRSGDEGAESVRVFDAEFGVYGPTGFDLGQLQANLRIAAARADVLGESERAELLHALPDAVQDAFEAEFRALWPSRVDDRVFGDGVLESHLAEVRADAMAFAGAEGIRRSVGFARTSDLESLEPELRARAIREVLRTSRALLLGEHPAAAAG